MSGLFFTIAAVARAECDDPELLLESLEQATASGRFEEAETSSKLLVEALGCGKLAHPSLVARMWVTEAVLLSVRGEVAASDDALAAAARIAPSEPPELYGSAVRKRWEAASRRPLPEMGRVRLDPLPEGYLGVIDGALHEFPTDLPAGLHLLQVGPELDRMETARVFDLPPGLDLVLELPFERPLQGPVPEERAPRTRLGWREDPRKRRVLGALLVGGAGGLGYSATLLTEAAYYRKPEGERSTALMFVNDGLLLSSAGLGLTSVALLVRGLTTPPP
jgi:hypothetical protein